MACTRAMSPIVPVQRFPSIGGKVLVGDITQLRTASGPAEEEPELPARRTNVARRDVGSWGQCLNGDHRADEQQPEIGCHTARRPRPHLGRGTFASSRLSKWLVRPGSAAFLSEPCIRSFRHLIVSTSDRPGVVPGSDARVRVPESVGCGHDAVPISDPSPV